MSVTAMLTTLKTLRLYGMAQSIEELAEQAAPAYQQAAPILNNLLKAEVADRESALNQLSDEDRQLPGSPVSHGP